MKKIYYRIEEVAKRTGLTKRAIRYYESVDLIKPERAESQYRLYTEEDIDKITRIKAYKHSLGFTLNEIKDTFDLEWKIDRIASGENRNKDDLEAAIQAIESQIVLIEKKEGALRKLKEKFLEILSDMREKHEEP